VPDEQADCESVTAMIPKIDSDGGISDGIIMPALPPWRQIQRALEQDIRQGQFKAGERLPTEEELAKRFGVHRNTVRRAIARLREKDLIHVQQGGGTFVKEASVVYPLGPETRLTLTVEGVRRRSIRRVLASGVAKADRATALAFGVPVGQPVCRVETVRHVDGRPLAAGLYHYPLPRFEGIDGRIRELGSISAAMREFGVQSLVRRSLRVRARQPSAHDARILGINRSNPVLDLYAVSLDEMDKAVQTNHSRVVSTSFDLLFKFDG
jgi:GntR family phosphonate transport system transcriptional regulator